MTVVQFTASGNVSVRLLWSEIFEDRGKECYQGGMMAKQARRNLRFGFRYPGNIVASPVGTDRDADRLQQHCSRGWAVNVEKTRIGTENASQIVAPSAVAICHVEFRGKKISV